MWKSKFSDATVLEPDGSISEPMSARELEDRAIDFNSELRTNRVIVSKHGDTSIYFESNPSNAMPLQSQLSEEDKQNVPYAGKNLVKSFRQHNNDENLPPKFRRRSVKSSVSALRVRAEERLSRLERLQVINLQIIYITSHKHTHIQLNNDPNSLTDKVSASNTLRNASKEQFPAVEHPRSSCQLHLGQQTRSSKRRRLWLLNFKLAPQQKQLRPFKRTVRRVL